MLADTFLKRRLSQFAFKEEQDNKRESYKKHTLVLVKSESRKGERLIKYALNQKTNGPVTILCVLKLSLSSELLNGRVLEPMGDEDMALTEIQRIVNSVQKDIKHNVDIKILAGDPLKMITKMISTLNPDLIVVGYSQSNKGGIWNQKIPQFLLKNVDVPLYVSM